MNKLEALTGVLPPLQSLAVLEQSILDAIPTGLYVCSADGVIVRFNKRATELWGRATRPGDSEQRFCGAFRLYTPEGKPLPHAMSPMASVLQSGTPERDREVLIERPDGSRIVAVANIQPLMNGGRVEGAINCFQEITERKKAEEALSRRIDEQAALYQFIDSLRLAGSIDRVFDAALEAILRALRCTRASVLLLDDSDVMRFVAWRGLSDAYRHAVEGHSPWTPETKDPRPIHIDDVELADLPESLKETFRKEGIRALGFTPIMASRKLAGKFMTYYDDRHDFSDGEVALAIAIARQIGISIERMRGDEARTRAEQELRRNNERERARAAELQAIMHAVPAVVWVARDPECRVITGNPAAFEFLRLPLDANLSLSAPEGDRPRHFEVLANGRVLAPEDLPVQRAARGEDVRNSEHETRFKDGTSRYLLGNATPLRDAEGNPCGAVAAFVDITERKKAEEQRDLLVAELSHRVKNTLATVISIAQQTFSKTPSADQARRTFDARIRALAQTHSRLAEAGWSGTYMDLLVRDQLSPHSDESGTRVRTAGPRLALKPRCALMLGMAVHELATNAAKYGALSGAVGQVDVVWRVELEKEQLLIRWAESGGPLVARADESGFGRLLLERALASDLGGDVQLEFAQSGVRCAISIPLEGNISFVA